MRNSTRKAKLLEDLMSSQGKKIPTSLLLTFNVGHVVNKRLRWFAGNYPKRNKGCWNMSNGYSSAPLIHKCMFFHKAKHTEAYSPGWKAQLKTLQDFHTRSAIPYILQCDLYALFCTTSHRISIICKAIKCHKEIAVKFLPRENFHSSNWQGERV